MSDDERLRRLNESLMLGQRRYAGNGLASGLHIATGDAFVADFQPPEWLIEGVVQRGRLYACTSLTGHGKTAVWLFNACMIQLGRMIGSLSVEKGNVLYLAGENPEDVKARMIGMCAAFRFGSLELPYVLARSFPMGEEEALMLRREIEAMRMPLALIVGDTAASFFPGEDENDNVQAGQFARTMRGFTECPGHPAVVMLTHPTKHAAQNNLLPRGGGAFLNELDGNLTLWSEERETTSLHWQGKIRGPDFSPLSYRMRSIATGYRDRRGHPVMTVVAEPMSDDAAAGHARQVLTEEDVVLRALKQHPDWSYAQIAEHAGWLTEGGEPLKSKVHRSVQALAADKLVTQLRKGGRWIVTQKGEKLL